MEKDTKINWDEIKVHPKADMFPMIPQDDLEELAESIANNGQRLPIILVKNCENVLLIDGRNRLAACKIAKIEPKYEYFEGKEDDILAYIADINLNRRNLNAGQRAVALAKIYPVAIQGGKRVKGQVENFHLTIDKSQLGKARIYSQCW